MRKQYRGSILLTALIILSGLFALLFLHKERIFYYKNHFQNDYANYLVEHYDLVDYLDQDEQEICKNQNKDFVIFQNKYLSYSVHCQCKSIFIQPKPTQGKYIQVDNIYNFLDIYSYEKQIYKVSSLSELPESSENNPKIVIATHSIDEKLEKDFYGIIITDNYFDITGKKIYGVLYSSYDNEREERNLTYKRKVIDNIEKQFSFCEYLPHSKSIFDNEKDD